MEKFERDARAEIPAGYAIINDGPIMPDDMVWIYPAGGFMRHDSPDWNCSPVTDAADAVLVIRRGRAPDMPGATRRTYHLPRATPEKTLPDPATSKTASRSLQPKLFV